MSFLRQIKEDKVMNQHQHNASPMSRRLLVTAATFVYLSSALLPAYASDTEIYTRANTAATLSPSIMFMIDTSGSMAWCMDRDNATSSCVGGLRSAAVKTSMNDALNGSGAIPGFVNVGLSTYDVAGTAARVRYPARPLDALIELEQDGTTLSQVTYGESDAEQLPTAGGVQDLVRDELSIGFKAGQAQSVGLHFTEILVPRGADIRSAKIVFAAKASDTSDAIWQVEVADSDDAPPFAAGAASVNGRAYLSKHDLPRPDKWTAGTTYSVDVKDQVDEIVKRAGWCGGQAMSFRIFDVTGAGSPARRAYSYEGALAAGTPSLAPQLEISYVMESDYFATPPKASCTYLPFATLNNLITLRDDDGYWAPTGFLPKVTTNASTTPIAQVTSGVNRFAGLRFKGVAIPKDAIIKQASLLVTASNNYSSIPPINISVYDDDTTPTFASGGALPTTAIKDTFQWQPPANSFSTGVRYTIPKIPQLGGAVTQQVQSIVNRADWNSGDNIVFRLSNSTLTNHDVSIRALSSDGLVSTNPALYVRGYQKDKVTDLRTLTTVREQLTSAVNALTYANGTPLGRAYLETARSMMGMSKAASSTADVGTQDGSGRYITTVKSADTCAANYIFALTDGDPSTGTPTGADTSDFGASACTKPADVTLGSTATTDFSCMAGVARQLADAKGSIKTKVFTNTVILGPLAGQAAISMAGVAKAGRGKYYEAKTPGDLGSAIKETIDALLNVSGTVSAPGVAVNQLSRLSHLDQLYYSVFNPRSDAARWQGNVKRYRLNLSAGSIDDMQGLAAIDPATTFFKDTAKSFWLPAGTPADGKDAALGGAANLLPAPDARAGAGTARNMYTYYAAYPSTPASASGQALSKIVAGDALLKSAMGLSDNTIFNNLTAWLLGYEVNDLSDVQIYDASSALRHEMGGGLHSRPALVNYGYSGTLAAALANADLQDNTVYFSTMEGVLHAINAKDGKEVFSFVPKEALPRVQTLYVNSSQPLPEFGLDTSWAVYRIDGDGDFKINSGGAGGDKIVIYGGMRMGGSNYYALDVTNRASPKLLFSLSPTTSSSFTNMGQTWSEPVVSLVKINGVAKTVLVFGGGYDPKHETAGYSAGAAPGSDSDAKGNQIYIVDAITGELYWWASNAGSRPASGQVADMKFSIAAGVKRLDVNSDGYDDVFYVGDLGGQMFRLDVDNANTGKDTLIKRVNLFAKLAQKNTANQRRIYETPSVALLLDKVTKKPYIGVAIGTGYRSHPLDEATIDMFYMLTDNDALRADLLSSTPNPALQAVITGPGNISNPGTDELAMVNLNGVSGVSLTGKKGWYFPLAKPGEAGEKVLASPLIFSNEVYFTSYVPTAAVDACSPVAGASRLYRMSASDAAVVTDANNTGGLDATDRASENVVLGIGGDPQLIISNQTPPPPPLGKDFYCDGKKATSGDLAAVTILVGTNAGKTEVHCLSGLSKTRWYQRK